MEVEGLGWDGVVVVGEVEREGLAEGGIVVGTVRCPRTCRREWLVAVVVRKKTICVFHLYSLPYFWEKQCQAQVGLDLPLFESMTSSSFFVFLCFALYTSYSPS